MIMNNDGVEINYTGERAKVISALVFMCMVRFIDQTYWSSQVEYFSSKVSGGYYSTLAAHGDSLGANPR